MKIAYKNRKLELGMIIVKAMTSAMVVASFVALFGFDEPLLPAGILYLVQIALLIVFIAGKIVRVLNAVSKREWLLTNWFEIPLLILLAGAVLGAGPWFGNADPTAVRHLAVGIYLMIEVIVKVCVNSVRLAATGRNPTLHLIASFVVLIVAGAGLLVLPRSSAGESLRFVDALFTATSATCVTGLVVKDTGQDFSLMGQIVILTLIQLGGLGIVVFGAVFALLLGQALSLRESVAMQDLLSARTISRIGSMIVFIFIGTMIVEALGAVAMFGIWDNVPGWKGGVRQQWFCSVFHSISAFCNAGFSLFSDSLVRYNRSWAAYCIVCPLIILGGLGFGVLNNLAIVAADRIKRLFKKAFGRQHSIYTEVPKRMLLQTKLVLSVSGILIVVGAVAILLFERFAAGPGPRHSPDVLGALFQSITARTAGFNTVDIAALSPSSRLVLMLLMFIGGSPGSTAGGIKTVTFAVVVLTIRATLRKRSEVEVFKRAIRLAVVRRAITVTFLFVAVLLTVILALTVAENGNPQHFGPMDIMFEAASALGTVGLTTGVTPHLTDAGKLIIIATMLIGRLGPLTLLAALTLNLKPVPYNYPEEAIIVG